MSDHPESDDIYERLYRAVLEQRLRPKTKLTEQRLAAIFSASRATVRQALARLEHERIVEQIPHRGAFVAEPSAKECADVLDARRLIEPALARRLAISANPRDITLLRDHAGAELTAREGRDDSAAIRLSGEFHNLLATLAGNAALAASMRPLTARTSLAILIHHPPTAAACRPDEHEIIVDRIATGAGELAASALVEHLDHVQAALASAPARSRDELELILSSPAAR
jgi:DNA-binding GntR family transcriptional regulator